MIIKVNKTWKDLLDNVKPHTSLSRRDLLVRGMATGAMSVVLPNSFFGEWMNKAMAAGTTMNCPAPTLNPGVIAQIFSNGGPTMGARFISDAQAAAMNATMAANYGVSGQANLVKLGPNLNIDKTSPFGATLLQGPPGYTGGSANWQKTVLTKISGGGHLGPFNQDDGAGQNTGLIGGISPFKTSQMGKDLKIGVQNTLAAWANGLPAASITGTGTTASLASTFSLTPAAAGLTNTTSLTAASNAANALAQDLGGVFNTANRKGASILQNSVGCAFYGNAVLANPTYGSTLFTPTNIAALTAKLTVSALSGEQQAQLAALYQSAVGVAGGVQMQFNGRDYHGQSPQGTIAPADVEEASAIVMFLAACDAAQSRGAMIYTANGQAIASGTQSVAATIFGTATTVNAPVAQGDAGGSYNAGLIMFYSPTGAPPTARFTGTVNSTTGNAATASTVGSSLNAMAGLYLSGLAFINGGTPPAAAVTAMQKVGAAATPSAVMVI